MSMNESKNSILLVQSPRIWPRLPPLGMAALYGYLRANGIDVSVMDVNQRLYQVVDDSIKQLWELPVYPAFSRALWDFLNRHHPQKTESLIEEIAGHPAQVIGFSVWHSSLHFSVSLAQAVKLRAPEKRIVAGGPEVTLRYRANKDITNIFSFADLIIVGEGEKALLNYLTNGADAVNKICVSDPPEIRTLPAPDFSGLKSYPYRYSSALPVWMSRGCIRRCAFCAEHTLTDSFRMKNPRTVVDELQHFYFHDGISHFVFYDSLINGDLQIFEEFLDRMVQSALPIKWEGQVLIRRDMPSRLFVKMKQAGCYNMFIGLESGSNRILKLMRKGFTTEDATRFFQYAYNAGLHFEVSMILGFPGEQEDDFRTTIRFFQDNALIIPKLAQANPYIELEASPIFRENGIRGRIPPSQVVRQWITELVETCRQNNIAVTPAYINNLTLYEAGFDAVSGKVVM
ncbi:MAG: radical SAM protein [Candidatus Auribacter fodinae]|jgi:radical SAM superfamily enzyme YgiQ (UPF0313 family)|uniref:Radical SAM protein n=1 Tax=Candidatus Auribacter fodinae TaxID=2093366 RepID=A0A3A4R705_9BACT|nr:MAG: radical SAM protein [Candidatus Auribacter fodinae]